MEINRLLSTNPMIQCCMIIVFIYAFCSFLCGSILAFEILNHFRSISQVHHFTIFTTVVIFIDDQSLVGGPLDVLPHSSLLLTKYISQEILIL